MAGFEVSINGRFWVSTEAIPASSGVTNRHRLFRGGHRQANAALFRIATVRMRWHEPTIAYVVRRTTEGLSKKDILRCLKRFIAREIYHGLLRDHRARATANADLGTWITLLTHRGLNALAESVIGLLRRR